MEKIYIIILVLIFVLVLLILLLKGNEFSKSINTLINKTNKPIFLYNENKTDEENFLIYLKNKIKSKSNNKNYIEELKNYGLGMEVFNFNKENEKNYQLTDSEKIWNNI